METKIGAIMLLFSQCFLLPIIFLCFVLYFPFTSVSIGLPFNPQASCSELRIISLKHLITFSKLLSKNPCFSTGGKQIPANRRHL